MEGTYKYSYKTGESLSNALSVYNTGYQKCEPGYQWGPGVRNHYCIHHVIAGTGYYEVHGNRYQLEAGDTFILYPDTEVKYYADQEKPWEYTWVGFEGADAGILIGATDFSPERPLIRKGTLPDPEIEERIQESFALTEAGGKPAKVQK